MPVQQAYALPIDECGKCILAKEIKTNNGKCTNKIQPMKWGCTSECKPLTDAEVSAIVDFKKVFDRPAQEVRLDLDMCDRHCPYQHYIKFVDDATVDLQDHPLVYFNNGSITAYHVYLHQLQHIFQC